MRRKNTWSKADVKWSIRPIPTLTRGRLRHDGRAGLSATKESYREIEYNDFFERFRTRIGRHASFKFLMIYFLDVCVCVCVCMDVVSLFV